jgi:hypothetical protein
VPQSGRISLGISIISYNGRVWLGIATDEGLIPDPEAIISRFYLEYQELSSRAVATGEKRQEDMHPMLARLNESLGALDKLLAEMDSNPIE